MNARRWAAVAVATLLVGSALTVAVTAAAASGPAIQVSSVTTTPTDPITGESVTFETTVSNLQQTTGTVQVTDVYLRRSGSTTEYARAEDVGSVAPGGSLTVPLTAGFENPGEKSLTVFVVVQNRQGRAYSYSYPARVDVAAPAVRGGLSAQDRPSGGASVTLTNYGNVNFTDVEISAVVDGEVRDRRFMQSIPPDSSQNISIDTGETDTVTFNATYTANDTSHGVSRTVDLDRQLSGEVGLTSVDVTRRGQTVSIDGEAANVGGTDVQSVLLDVQDSDTARPVQGSGDFFVGQIEASEFATFELAAAVESGIETVTVEITYIVDDDRVTTTRHIDVSSAEVSNPPDGTTGNSQAARGDGGSTGGLLGGLPLLGIGVVLLVALIVATVAYRRRNR